MVPELLMPLVPEVVPVVPLAPVVPLTPAGVPLVPAARSVPVGLTPIVLPALPVGLVGPVLGEPSGVDGLVAVVPAALPEEALPEEVLPEEPALCAKASGAPLDSRTAVSTAIEVVRMARFLSLIFTTSTPPGRCRSENVTLVKSESMHPAMSCEADVAMTGPAMSERACRVATPAAGK